MARRLFGSSGILRDGDHAERFPVKFRRLSSDQWGVNFYLARQPILDRGWNIAGYELFFRSAPDDDRGVVMAHETAADGSATSDVIANAVLGVGLDRLLGEAPAFVNFDARSLGGDWSTLLPPERIVIELLESVAPENAVFAICERLRQQGYALALKIWRDDARTAAFAPFVDILKVDFENAAPDERAALAKRYHGLGLRLVAEKVATDEEFQAASRLAYDYFQGHFFASPSVLRTSRVPASNPSSLRLLKLVQQEELDFDAIGAVVRHDVGFSHSLLKYLNSAAFCWATKIESVPQGLLLLGAEGIRRWVWMASLRTLAQNRPPVLVAQVLMRGRFCEMLVDRAGLSREADPFLTGMFSLLDAILQKPLVEILDELSIGARVRSVLLGTAGQEDALALSLRMVKAYERADFEDVGRVGRTLGLGAEDVSRCYLESLHWVGTFIATYEHTWPATGGSERSGFHRTEVVGKKPGVARRDSVLMH